ncbi:MAG: hypothetical protein LLG00_12315, partial [Planctomycetaceae bacterium]|nr:hypothetical protein [Planctomycetaceae bacterium]
MRLLERQPWLLYVLPFLVYMLAGSLEPTALDKPGGTAIGLSIPYAYYPVVYAIKIALTIGSVAFVWPGYRQFAPRITLLGIVVGIVGAPLWIGLCRLDIEHQHLVPLLNQVGLGGLIGAGERSAFDPMSRLSTEWAWAFLAVRFLGLVAVVPLVEEFFLRGFVMRFVMERDWWKVPFGSASRLAIVLGTAFPMLTHPGELLAAAV